METQLPDVRQAKLPDTYLQAKRALQECSRIDECMDWADKAHALASYAKQAKDETLERLANRIKARAIRRCGELLKQIDARGAHRKKGGGVPFSRTKAAANAGLSERQRKTATRVANVSDDKFESMMESEKSVTVTEIAEAGTAKQQHHPSFPKATHLLGTLSRFADFCSMNDAADVAEAVMEHETEKAKKWVTVIDQWLDVFVTNLKERR
ncbi:MAG: hypothetical protein ACYTEW_26270 [Planctomycetota bacterium]|jgi:hypothetical protein